MKNKEKLQRARELSKELLEIASSSTNPDDFTALEEALERLDVNLVSSLGGENK